MKIAIINGPNLNILGKREPGIYGDISFDVYFHKLKTMFEEIEFSYFQSNVEGEIIDELQRVGYTHDGIILNAGGYTHTSVAIGDAVGAVDAPVVEVHISNIAAREEFRKVSLISAKSAGMISGLGLDGYELAVRYFSQRQ